MPYPTEHAARLVRPSEFAIQSFQRRSLGGGVSVILANREGSSTLEAQAYRFDHKKFTPQAAQKWVKDHDAKILSFEPATNEDSVVKNVAAIMAQAGVSAGLVVNEDGVQATAADEVAVNEDNSRACLVHNLGKLTRVEKHDGVDYLVAPTVLICEGVHNNLYYPPEELSKFCDAWNGRPVVVFHPQTSGKAVTANSPAVWWGKGGSKVGYVFNTRWDAAAGKLRADIYVDPVKCREAGQHGMQAIDTLESEGPLEVSTGLFTELRVNAGGAVETGTWKGEQFKGVAINHRPDHLALLPGLKGACSWDDGAGSPRVNVEANTEDVVENAGTSEGAKKAWDARGRGRKEKEKSTASKFASKGSDGGSGFEGYAGVREFEKSDWSGFAGAEGWDDNNPPLIAELGDGGVAIADRNGIQVITGDGDEVHSKDWGANSPAKWGGESPDEIPYARSYAAEMLSRTITAPAGALSKKGFMRINKRNSANYTANADGVMVNAELSHSQLAETLSKLIKTRFTPENAAQPGNPSPCMGPWLVDVFDDCAVFDCDGKVWRIEYTSGDEGVELDDGPATEVQRQMSYEPVNNAGTSEGAKKAWDARGRSALQAAEKILVDHGKKYLKSLRNNENNEDSGDTGPHNNEETGMKDEGNKKTAQAAPVVNATPAAPVATPETLETVLAGIKDGGLRTLVAEGVEAAKQVKAALVEKLATNGAYSKDELEAMTTPGLKKLSEAFDKITANAEAKAKGKAKCDEDEEDESKKGVRVNAGGAPLVVNKDNSGVPAMPAMFPPKAQ